LEPGAVDGAFQIACRFYKAFPSSAGFDYEYPHLSSGVFIQLLQFLPLIHTGTASLINHHNSTV
jgi:hypothetical protein